LNAQILDAADELNRAKNAIGFMADHAKDQQLSAALSLIEDSLEDVLKMLESAGLNAQDSPNTIPVNH